MSDMAGRLSDSHNPYRDRAARPGAVAPAWWLVCSRELTDLWIGGKALILLLVYTVLLGLISFVVAINHELDLIPPKELVFLTLQIAIAAGAFLGLIIGADSLSGERERATLEPLLLTPVSRRQIVVGKFLAGISPWPLVLLITVPYLAVLAQGDEVLGPALFWGLSLGSVMAVAYTGLGMVVSFWCTTNRTSLFVSLTLYLLTFLPTQLPGQAQKGLVGKLVQRANPMEATNEFLEKILVNNRTLAEFRSWLVSPIVVAAALLGLLLLYAGPRLRLEARRR
jgi:ABC-2 type transport system permease protein